MNEQNEQKTAIEQELNKIKRQMERVMNALTEAIERVGRAEKSDGTNRHDV